MYNQFKERDWLGDIFESRVQYYREKIYDSSFTNERFLLYIISKEPNFFVKFHIQEGMVRRRNVFLQLIINPEENFNSELFLCNLLIVFTCEIFFLTHLSF